MTHNTERYGIFRKLPDGSPIWLGAESDLGKAMQTMHDLASADGAEYFVHDFDKGISMPVHPPEGDVPPVK